MTQHRTNLPFAIDAPPHDHTIMRTPSPSSPTSATAFFGRRLRFDSFDSIDTVSSEFSLPSSSSSSSSSFSLKQRKPIKQMKNYHHHNRNDFLFCGPNENGGFLGTITTPKQQQSTVMDLPQHSSGRPFIEFTFAKDENNNDDVIPELLLVPVF
jgi:hypothetical protein